jgi:hypothetical protein
MLDFLLRSGGAFSKQSMLEANHQLARIGLAFAVHCGALGQSLPGKKQGRRRSMPPTTLPAPDIEIGLRHPVNCILQRKNTGACDPVHIPRKKYCDFFLVAESAQQWRFLFQLAEAAGR